jgi:DNA-directed RNA polymerase subunit RPC12/RpoP
MTFLESYGEWLDQQIANGGSAQDMGRAVTEYNAIGRGGYVPTTIYRGWSQKSDHVCSACGATFRWRHAAIPDPSGEVRCDACTQKSTPVSGTSTVVGDLAAPEPGRDGTT